MTVASPDSQTIKFQPSDIRRALRAFGGRPLQSYMAASFDKTIQPRPWREWKTENSCLRQPPLWCLTAPPSPRCEACHTILRSLTLPYESCSLATPLLGRATKGKRLQDAHRGRRGLDDDRVHILCRMCTVGLWVLCNVPHVSTSKHRGNLPLRGRRRHRRQKGCISRGRRPVVRFSPRPLGRF